MSFRTRTYIRDSQQAFAEALRRGLMTYQSVCKWMYMYSDASHDYFKHTDTREYWAIDRFGEAAKDPTS